MNLGFDTLIYKIKAVREGFLGYLGNELIVAISHSNDGLSALELLAALMNLPASKLSLVKHLIWDFNGEPHILARDIQGSKSRIDFGIYESLNSTILFELKIAILCMLEIPGALRHTKKPRSYKPHTVLDIFKSVIPFINQMCARKRVEHGDRFFEGSHFSLADFTEQDYRTEAEVFDRAFRGVMLNGFQVLRSHFLVENLFPRPLVYVDLENLGWKQNSVKNKQTRTKSKWFSNKIFEKSSREGSFAVVDFLKALKEDISDQDTLSRIDMMGYDQAKKAKITRRNYDIYVAIRLTSRGYTGLEVEPYVYNLEPVFWSPQNLGMLKDKEALCKLTRAPMDNDLYEYLTHISNSASYIIGQYTGMRPSELSGCLIDDCLTVDEFGHDLITSRVIKNREAVRKLFDDMWVAIPIVKDAVKALQILNRFKQNPYLFSNMNTIKPGMQHEANSLSGSGLGHQLCAFLSKTLTVEEYDEIEVSPYTLRHSLANQMLRAAVGLPFMSYQLKHFGHHASTIGQDVRWNHLGTVTIDYGGIGEALTSGGGPDAPGRVHAETEFIMNSLNPAGGYAGENAPAHRARLENYFKGYLEAGYSNKEIFERMAELNFAVINVGQGYCYGNATELDDPSIPCIGSLRCNPNRCKNAVVTEANAPKWQEIYVQNTLALRRYETDPAAAYAELRDLDDAALSIEQMKLAISEAKGVLLQLGIEMLV
jgi:integrase